MIALLIIMMNLMILIFINLIIISHGVSETFLIASQIICLLLIQ